MVKKVKCLSNKFTYISLNCVYEVLNETLSQYQIRTTMGPSWYVKESFEDFPKIEEKPKMTIKVGDQFQHKTIYSGQFIITVLCIQDKWVWAKDGTGGLYTDTIKNLNENYEPYVAPIGKKWVNVYKFVMGRSNAFSITFSQAFDSEEAALENGGVAKNKNYIKTIEVDL